MEDIMITRVESTPRIVTSKLYELLTPAVKERLLAIGRPSTQQQSEKK